MIDKVPSRRGARVKVLTNDNGTTLAPGVILRASADRAHVLLKKSGEYVVESFRLHDWKNEYIARENELDTNDPRIERAYADLVYGLLEESGKLPPLSGDESISEADQLVGRYVNMMLTNGICVVGVKIHDVQPYVDERRLIYKLPDTHAYSEVALHSIGHLHVFGSKDDPDMQFNPTWYIHLGRGSH